MLYVFQRVYHSALLLSICLSPCSQAVLADYFVYRGKDGVTWYTDRRLPKATYSLIATIGRPTATVSCQGMTPSRLNQRAKAHASFIEQYSRRYNVDQQLIKAIISVESCFDKYAVSRVGAKGLMQLMPATAEHMGVRNVFDARDNLRGGIRYFSLMMQRFNSNTELALAAYNAGPQTVVKYNGIPPYKETQHYVERVLDAYQRYINPG
ncbi:MAG: lytic transglycosylase domain-containing protein [Pseudomonadota bacterium]